MRSRCGSSIHGSKSRPRVRTARRSRAPTPRRSLPPPPIPCSASRPTSGASTAPTCRRHWRSSSGDCTRRSCVRPLRVKVKGFTAFADEVDLDFAGLDLFAITGPTGSGKTSLIQSIPIALYGRAPKVADDLRQLISPSAEHARFHCEFMARGGRYRISRVIHRTRPTSVALEEHVSDDEWRSLARGVRQANEKIEELLGLDYDTFTRLLSLEIYGKIQQRANQVAAAARTEVDVLTSILERDYADATPERLAEV